MHYTIYSETTPGTRCYEGFGRDLNAAFKACDLLAKYKRHPLVLVPRNPRLPAVRYTLPQNPLPNATLKLGKGNE
jgi:hypothetical protein